MRLSHRVADASTSIPDTLLQLLRRYYTGPELPNGTASTETDVVHAGGDGGTPARTEATSPEVSWRLRTAPIQLQQRSALRSVWRRPCASPPGRGGKQRRSTASRLHDEVRGRGEDTAAGSAEFRNAKDSSVDEVDQLLLSLFTLLYPQVAMPASSPSSSSSLSAPPLPLIYPGTLKPSLPLYMAEQKRARALYFLLKYYRHDASACVALSLGLMTQLQRCSLLPPPPLPCSSPTSFTPASQQQQPCGCGCITAGGLVDMNLYLFHANYHRLHRHHQHHSSPSPPPLQQPYGKDGGSHRAVGSAMAGYPLQATDMSFIALQTMADFVWTVSHRKRGTIHRRRRRRQWQRGDTDCGDEEEAPPRSNDNKGSSSSSRDAFSGVSATSPTVVRKRHRSPEKGEAEEMDEEEEYEMSDLSIVFGTFFTEKERVWVVVACVLLAWSSLDSAAAAAVFSPQPVAAMITQQQPPPPPPLQPPTAHPLLQLRLLLLGYSAPAFPASGKAATTTSVDREIRWMVGYVQLALGGATAGKPLWWSVCIEVVRLFEESQMTALHARLRLGSQTATATASGQRRQHPQNCSGGAPAELLEDEERGVNAARLRQALHYSARLMGLFGLLLDAMTHRHDAGTEALFVEWRQTAQEMRVCLQHHPLLGVVLAVASHAVPLPWVVRLLATDAASTVSPCSGGAGIFPAASPVHLEIQRLLQRVQQWMKTGDLIATAEMERRSAGEPCGAQPPTPQPA